MAGVCEAWWGEPGKEAGTKARSEVGEMQPPLSLGTTPE